MAEDLRSAILSLTGPNSKQQQQQQQQQGLSRRVEAYTVLTGLLKSKSLKGAVDTEIFSSRKDILHVILSDVGDEGSVSQLAPHALQTLGYLLFNERLARSLDKETVSRVVEGICNLTKRCCSVKSICTHCLWCLANQNMDKELIASQVPLIANTIHDLIVPTNGILPSPSTVSESVNVLEKLFTQCSDELMEVAQVWYEPLVVIMFSKYTKVHQKVMKFVDGCENLLALKSSLVMWLGKELKNHLASTMMTTLSTKRLEHHVMTVWAHFVTVLGRMLHTSGTFLNKMLKIVEMGFKHMHKPVQMAAYNIAWQSVIRNFSTHIDLLKTPKKLDLLLLPLVNTALKNHDVEVDKARVVTWWYLITNLLTRDEILDKIAVFEKVCLPMVLFCLGLHPKTTLSKALISSGSAADGQSNGAQEPSRWNFAVLFEPATVSSSTSHYPFTPSAEMLYSAGQAMLEFLGVQQVVGRSLLSPLLKCCVLYPESVVSLQVAPCLLLVAVGLSRHSSLLEPSTLQVLLRPLLSSVITSLAKYSQEPSAVDLLVSFLDFFDESTLLNARNKMVLLSQVGNLPSSLIVSILTKQSKSGQRFWQQLQQMILVSLTSMTPSNDQKRVFLDLHDTIVGGMCSLCGDQQLVVYQWMCSALVKRAASWLDPNRTLLGQCWTILTTRFTNFLKETSTINEGSSSQPDFSLAMMILEFPFQYAMPQGELQSSQLILTWKKLFYVCSVSIGLVVKDPTLAVRMVSDRLLLAAKEVVTKLSSVAACSEQSGRVNLVDSYLVSLASACQHLVDAVSNSFSSFGRTEGIGGALGREGNGGDGLMATAHSISSLLSWLLQQSFIVLNDSQHSIDCPTARESATRLLELAHRLYCSLLSTKLLHCATKLLAPSLCSLMNFAFSIKPSTLSNSKQLREMHEVAQNVWNAMCAQFMRSDQSSINESLELLARLLEITMNCKTHKVVDKTVEYWNGWFGKAKSLDYSSMLRSTIPAEVAGRMVFPSPSDPSKVVAAGLHRRSGEEKGPESQSLLVGTGADSEVMEVEESEPFIVHPNPTSSSTTLPSVPSSSTSLVLGKGSLLQKDTATTAPTCSTIQARSTSPGSSKDMGAAVSGVKFVTIPPSSGSAGRRLLTEHQKEKQRERPCLPAMYNGLENTQDTQPLESSEPLDSSCSLVQSTTSNAVTPSSDTLPSSASNTVTTSENVSASLPAKTLSGANEENSDEGMVAKDKVTEAGVVSEPHSKQIGAPADSDVIDLTDSPVVPHSDDATPSGENSAAVVSIDNDACHNLATTISTASEVSSSHTLDTPTPTSPKSSTTLQPPITCTTNEQVDEAPSAKTQTSDSKISLPATESISPSSPQSATAVSSPSKQVYSDQQSCVPATSGMPLSSTESDIVEPTTPNKQVTQKPSTPTSVEQPVKRKRGRPPKQKSDSENSDTDIPKPSKRRKRNKTASCSATVSAKATTTSSSVSGTSTVNQTTGLDSLLTTTSTLCTTATTTSSTSTCVSPCTTPLSSDTQHLNVDAQQASSEPNAPAATVSGNTLASLTGTTQASIAGQVCDSSVIEMAENIDKPDKLPQNQGDPAENEKGEGQSAMDLATHEEQVGDKESEHVLKQMKESKECVADGQQNLTECEPDLHVAVSDQECDEQDAEQQSRDNEVSGMRIAGTNNDMADAQGEEENDMNVEELQFDTCTSDHVDLQSDIVEESEARDSNPVQPGLSIRDEDTVTEDTITDCKATDSEDPLSAALNTPSRLPVPTFSSPLATPVGILKRTSRYDSPTSMNKERHVQFALPVVAGTQEVPIEHFRTQSHSKVLRRSTRSPRRSLQLSPQPSSSQQPGPSSGVQMPTSEQSDPATLQPLRSPIFPSLMSCTSSIEDILSSLSPSGRCSQGLKNVVRARNIGTIGDIASLTAEEVECLPFKAPKLQNLLQILTVYQDNMAQAQKRMQAQKKAREEEKQRQSQKRARLEERSKQRSAKKRRITHQRAEEEKEGNEEEREEEEEVEEEEEEEETEFDEYTTEDDTEESEIERDSDPDFEVYDTGFEDEDDTDEDSYGKEYEEEMGNSIEEASVAGTDDTGFEEDELGEMEEEEEEEETDEEVEEEMEEEVEEQEEVEEEEEKMKAKEQTERENGLDDEEEVLLYTPESQREGGTPLQDTAEDEKPTGEVEPPLDNENPLEDMICEETNRELMTENHNVETEGQGGRPEENGQERLVEHEENRPVEHVEERERPTDSKDALDRSIEKEEKQDRPLEKEPANAHNSQDNSQDLFSGTTAEGAGFSQLQQPLSSNTSLLAIINRLTELSQLEDMNNDDLKPVANACAQFLHSYVAKK